MIKQVRFPSVAAAGYVRHMVVLESGDGCGEMVMPLVTNGHPSIIFLSSGGWIDGERVGVLTVLGHNRRPFSLVLRERFTLIAFFLQPYCLPALLGVGAGELTDRYVDLGLLRPGPARTFQQQLLDAALLDQRIGLMERLMGKLAVPDVMPAEKAVWATQAILSSEGRRSIVDLQQEMGMSERALQRLFEANIGLTPRMYGRICKFDAAFRQLEASNYTRLSDIAYEQGYADQSHFIRAFKEFTGLTPKEYIRRAAPYVGEQTDVG